LGVLAAELAPGRPVAICIWPPIGNVTGATIKKAGMLFPFPLPKSDSTEDIVVVEVECGSQVMASDDWLCGLLIPQVAEEELCRLMLGLGWLADADTEAKVLSTTVGLCTTVLLLCSLELLVLVQAAVECSEMSSSSVVAGQIQVSATSRFALLPTAVDGPTPPTVFPFMLKSESASALDNRTVAGRQWSTTSTPAAIVATAGTVPALPAGLSSAKTTTGERSLLAVSISRM